MRVFLMTLSQMCSYVSTLVTVVCLAAWIIIKLWIFFSENGLFLELQICENETDVRIWLNRMIAKVEVYTSQQLQCGFYSSVNSEGPYYVRGILADGLAQGGYRGKTDLVSLEQKRFINECIPNPSFASLVAIEFKYQFWLSTPLWESPSSPLGKPT